MAAKQAQTRSASSRKAPAKRAVGRSAAKKPQRKPTAAQQRKAAGASNSKAFNDATKKAEAILQDKRKADSFAGKALEKVDLLPVIGDVVDDLHTLIRMMTAYARGEYREVPWTTIVGATAAIVYVVNPMDVIPDVVPGIGYVDDAAVVGFVAATIRKDLDAFRGWEGRQGGGRKPTKPKPRKPSGSKTPRKKKVK